MNIDYIIGFFDADGYITLVRMNTKRNRTIVVGFTNTKLEILKAIKEFLDSKGLKGIISTKQVKKETHQIGYDLKYVGFNNVEKLREILKTRHSKKQQRFELVPKLKELTPRNGKYTEEMKQQRKELEERFLSITI